MELPSGPATYMWVSGSCLQQGCEGAQRNTKLYIGLLGNKCTFCSSLCKRFMSSLEAVPVLNASHIFQTFSAQYTWESIVFPASCAFY